MYIPNVIYRLIFHFSTGFDMKHNIFSAIDHIIEVKKHIPQIFFKPFVPTTDIFSVECAENSSYSMFWRPNPFINGNPFIPLDLICEDTIISVDFLAHMIDLISPDSLQSIRTRRYMMTRTVMSIEKHIRQATFSFVKYGKFFFLCSTPESFVPKNRLDGILARRIAHEITSLHPEILF